jgi:RND family efflux transporter MFP subunit
MSRKSVFVLLALLLVMGFGVYRGIDGRVATAASVEQETLKLAVPTVSVITPKPGKLQNEVILPGSMQAYTDAPIYSRTSGYLKRWYVELGAHVKQGQLLAEIEAPEVDQQVLQAESSLQQSRASLEQVIANFEQGKSNADLARVTAQRWNNLVGKGAVSRQENDQYQSQLQSQEANLRSLEKAIAVSRNNVSAMEADLARLKELRNYKQVKAPFAGVITARNTDVGSLINAGNGGPAQELFHLAATSPLRVFVSVPEIYSRAVNPGMMAELTLAEFPGRPVSGKVVRKSGSLDPATRTLLTELEVPNPTGELLPGSYAQVHFKLSSATPSLVVPVGALLFRSEGLRVGIVRDSGGGECKAELIPVVLGQDYGTQVEIAHGLSPDELVIENPPDSLVSGMAVRVVKR